MTESVYQSLGYGITCIDAGYLAPGVACFYLMEQGDACAVLETGTSHSVPRLEQLLRERGISREQVRYVIPTHVHLDHAGGVGAMMRIFPEAKLLIHPRGARHMVAPGRLVEGATAVYGETLFQQLYGEIEAVDAGRVHSVQDGEVFDLGGRPLEFRHTRGHAEHHFCIWDLTSRGWFSGDMFGVSYPWCRFPGWDFVLPSTTPSQFDPDAFLASLQLLDSYNPDRLYLTHHGELVYSRDKLALLRDQIACYREFAQDDALDPARLQERLADYAIGLLRQRSGSDDTLAWRKALAFDMQLNAQGLMLWRQDPD